MRIEQLKTSGIRIISLDANIHIVQGEGRSRSPFANVILILDDAENALIDTGCGLNLLRPILEGIPITGVVSTHSHPDHTGGNRLAQTHGARILVPDEGRDSIGNADRLALRMVGPELATPWKQTYLPVTGFEDFTPDGTFTDGQSLRFGRTTFTALHMPGHTIDHYCLYEPERRILIGADIDLSPFGPWYGNVESDIHAFQDSIARLLDMPIDIYISSHAKPVKGPYIARRLAAYRATFGAREAAIAACLPHDGWIDLETLTRRSPIYGYDYTAMDPVLFYGETRMVEKHLHDLVRQGAAIEGPDGYQRRT